MNVQRVGLPESGRISWLVLDDADLPVSPVSAYLAFLDDAGRSPNTIRAAAHHLKVFGSSWVMSRWIGLPYGLSTWPPSLPAYAVLSLAS
jgi:hypothetical protein